MAKGRANMLGSKVIEAVKNEVPLVHTMQKK